MPIAKTLSTAALLLAASALLAQPQTTTAPATAPASQAPAAQQPAAPAGNTQSAPSKKTPQPKTQAEYDAFKTVSAQTDPAQMEAAANDFAQKFPDSELRGYLFQQVMGAYQNANNPDKTLEMARATLKYDPYNPVALLTAGSTLAERAHENDLDRDDRLAEADEFARLALIHAADIPQPPNMTPEQFAEALAQLRGAAHDVLGTVAFKKQDYPRAIKEFNLAAGEEKDHTDAVVWLRMAVAQDKTGDIAQAKTTVDKAIASSEAGSQVRQLAEQEKARLEKLPAVAPAAH